MSVVIPAYNSSRFYKNFIRSIKKVSYPNVEFIFIDDGSTDGSFEKMKNLCNSDKRFKFIKNRRREGISEIRKIGIKKSRGKYVAFAAMDMEFETNLLDVLVSELERDRGLSGVVPLTFDIHKRNIIQASGIRIIPHTGWLVCLNYGKRKNFATKADYNILGGVGTLVRRNILKRIKGFDKYLVRNVEDVDLRWRIWVFGGKIKFIPKAVVYHWTAKPWSIRKNELNLVEQDFDLNKKLGFYLKIMN